ncbi:MAG: GSCFA domain-containing protein [Pseudomonadota bacterium]
MATAGSCFAQHISKRISEIGFNYFCPEWNDDLTAPQLKEQGYGTFSARYGNIYTIQQLRQLFAEAFERESKTERSWVKDSRVYDPYRPNVFPGGFASLDEMLEERARHLECVRSVFAESDVFVFTLGLTEGWRSKEDGAVFPLAPGVVAGTYDSAKHEFFNSTIDETRATLFSFIDALTQLNPTVKILLTVSPVPLIATFEQRHVLTSTVYSKSVLRVAAQEAVNRYDHVDYFPSYEIITGSPTGGLYFEEDMREVNAQGVSHAMRAFLSAYTSKGEAFGAMTSGADAVDYQSATDIVCDEEEIERSLKA